MPTSFLRVHTGGSPPQDHGIWTDREYKCGFLAPSVEYLRHQIESEGQHPVAEKVEAVQGAPARISISELKSYFGLWSYYSRLLPNFLIRTCTTPQTAQAKLIIALDIKAEKKTFEKPKQLLISSQLLVQFDPSLDIHLACDASAYNFGTVLSRTMTDGSENLWDLYLVY